MKALLLLPVTLLSLSAAASPALPNLRMDLDGDGTPDLIRVVPLNEKFNRLEVSLSGSGQVYTLDSLVPTLFEQRRNKEDDTGYCESQTFLELKKGERSSFLFTQSFGDEGGCSAVLTRTFTIRLGMLGLKVSSLLVHSYSWSMGDPSPVFDLRFDFAARAAHVRYYDVHDRDDKGNNRISHASAALPAECGPVSAGEFEKAAFPACTKVVVQQWKFLDCGRSETFRECPAITPGLND